MYKLELQDKKVIRLNPLQNRDKEKHEYEKNKLLIKESLKQIFEC